MDKNTVLITIICALISGLIATSISIYYQNKQQNKNIKIDLLRNIIGFSYEMTEDYKSEKYDIIKYLNAVYIIFNNSKPVIDALENYKKQSSNDNFITLIKKMCDDVGIKYKGINDSFIERPFIMRNKK